MRSLARLVQREVQTVGAVRRVGGEDGVHVVGIGVCGGEAVGRVGLVGEGFAV